MAETVEFQRENRLGIKYLIREVSYKEIVVQIKGTEKAMLIKVPMQQFLAGWFKWQINGDFIQDAFHFLNEDEREFILTGLMPGDWEKIFENLEES
jgi:hypothetical protein